MEPFRKTMAKSKTPLSTEVGQFADPQERVGGRTMVVSRPLLVHGTIGVFIAILMILPTVAVRYPVLAQEAANTSVRVIDFAFEPVVLRVAVGTTVTWTNVGSRAHTVTADDGSFDSGRLDPGEQFTLTFDQAGTVAYHGGYHHDMNASVVVTAEDPTAIEIATGTLATETPEMVPNQSTAQDAGAPSVDSLLATAQQSGFASVVHDGNCAEIGPEVAPLTMAFVPSGTRRGHPRALPVANSFSTISVGLDSLLEADHAIVVSGRDGNTLACGDIGGFLTSNGDLIIGLRPAQSSGLDGTVYLSPSDDPSQTTVSVFLTGEALRDFEDNDVASANSGTESEATEPTIVPEQPPSPVPTPTITTRQSGPSAKPRPAPELTLDYLQPDQRSGPYAGFAVRFTNNTDAEILNPQTEVIVELGGHDWNCQGYGDPISGAPVTGLMDVLGMPLVIPAGEQVPVVIYCRIPEVPLDTARLRLR